VSFLWGRTIKLRVNRTLPALTPPYPPLSGWGAGGWFLNYFCYTFPMSSITFKARKQVRAYSTQNKQNMNLSEVRMWMVLKWSPYNFRRQKTLGNYICDFVSIKHKIIIEVDGISHESKWSYDVKREQYLIDHGYKLLKFIGMIPYPEESVYDFVWEKIHVLDEWDIRRVVVNTDE